eukprot:304654-Amphidinium_carterae.1
MLEESHLVEGLLALPALGALLVLSGLLTASWDRTSMRALCRLYCTGRAGSSHVLTIPPFSITGRSK